MSGSLVSKQDNQGLHVLCQIPIAKATVNLLHNTPWNDNELWSTYMVKTHFVHETKFISRRCRCNESEDRSLEQDYFPSRKWNSSVCVAVACRIHDAIEPMQILAARQRYSKQHFSHAIITLKTRTMTWSTFEVVLLDVYFLGSTRMPTLNSSAITFQDNLMFSSLSSPRLFYIEVWNRNQTHVVLFEKWFDFEISTPSLDL